MKEFTYVIQDPVGLHARPAGFLLRRAKNYHSSVLVKAPSGREANAAKLMALMSMGAKAGDTLTFILEGDDEEILGVGKGSSKRKAQLAAAAAAWKKLG